MWSRGFLLTALSIAVLLVIVRAALPSWLRGYVNSTLDQAAQYSGSVGDVELHLWRGAYAINTVSIAKRTGSVAVPFFSCPRVEFSIDWRSLRQGQLRGRARMEQPKLNFVASDSPQGVQTGADEPWLKIIKDLYPFQIDKAEVVDGAVHFHAFHTQPAVDVFLSDVTATLQNLSNIEASTDPKPASLHAEATAMESGRVTLDMTLDPAAHRPTFDLAAQLLDLDVVELNTLSLAYADFDFSTGRFDLVVEASAHDGVIEGYAKPLFRDVSVVDMESLREGDPLKLLWETFVELAGAALKNQARDQFGTRFEFAGSLDDPQTSVLEVVLNVLYNAFVRAYLPQIEGSAAPSLAWTSELDGGRKTQETTDAP